MGKFIAVVGGLVAMAGGLVLLIFVPSFWYAFKHLVMGFVPPILFFGGFIGLIAGIIVVPAVVMFDKLKIDDPVGALSVHLVNGTWGTIAVGLFATDGGLFNGGNWIEFPPELTQVDARIVGLVGKHFPIGAPKVGAAFGCLVPRLVTGQFDPTTQKAVWPSTGNYCRGGAYDSNLLGCESIAILPEGMSKERFEWLSKVAGETIKTPGSESNFKEIFDKCWELRKSGQDLMIFNQFEEFGNYLWHFEVTGHAMEEVLKQVMRPNDHYRGMASATGSAGTIASGDYEPPPAGSRNIGSR